jgi:hypothetical protein
MLKVLLTVHFWDGEAHGEFEDTDVVVASSIILIGSVTVSITWRFLQHFSIIGKNE